MKSSASIFSFFRYSFVVLLLFVTNGVVEHAAAVQTAAPAATAIVDEPLQSDNQRLRSLESVRKIDDHPLYFMRYDGDYDPFRPISAVNTRPEWRWGCSLFVAFGDQGEPLFGRNFDWYHHPAIVLVTHPDNGYGSISMVDVSYLGYSLQDAKFDSIEGRTALLQAPLIPFDGMNEHGLTVGMAAVPDSKLPEDPDKPTIGSLRVIRLMLDQAKTVDEAIAVFEKFNIDPTGGPQIHYLIADANGDSALVELIDGEMKVVRRGEPAWQCATNFHVCGNEARGKQLCHRFSQLQRRLSELDGSMDSEQAFDLLQQVAQRNTEWSAVYDMKQGGLSVCLTRQFDNRYSFAIHEEQPVAK